MIPDADVFKHPAVDVAREIALVDPLMVRAALDVVAVPAMVVVDK